MMNDERITELLQQADAVIAAPRPVGISATGIRNRIHRRRIVAGGAFAVTAGVVLVAGLWCIRGRDMETKEQRIVSLEDQVKQLKVQSERTLALVRDVVAKEQQANRLRALETELAGIPDPAEQDEKAAFMLVYQADRMQREMNQAASAIATYEQVIRLYPQNHWAEVARQRIAEIRKSRTDKSGTQGETKWQHPSETSSV